MSWWDRRHVLNERRWVPWWKRALFVEMFLRLDGNEWCAEWVPRLLARQWAQNGWQRIAE